MESQKESGNRNQANEIIVFEKGKRGVIHIECGAYMESTAAAADAEKDIQETLKVCHQVTMEDVRKEKWAVNLAGRVLKLIAPLM